MTYIRWGKSSCPNVAGTELVYTGRAGGSDHQHSGGGANYLCMPLDPEYTLSYMAGVRDYGYVYRTEYEAPQQGSHNHNAPCAVCCSIMLRSLLQWHALPFLSCPDKPELCCLHD